MVISRDFRSFDELGRPFRPRRQAATKIRFPWKCSVASNRIIRRVSRWIYPIRVRCKCSYLWNLTSPFRERFRVRALGFPDAQPLTFQKDAGPHPQYFFFAVANKRDICIWYRRPRIRKIHFMKWSRAREADSIIAKISSGSSFLIPDAERTGNRSDTLMLN